LDPHNADAYYYRGLAHSENNDTTSAIEDFTKAIDINSKDPGYYFQRGVARAESDNFDGALADFNASIDLYPDNPGTYYERGKVRARKGDFNGAINDFTQVIKIGSNQTLVYYSYIARAYARARSDDLDGAVNDATHATDSNPQNGEGWNSLCWLGTLAGRALQVIKACEQAVALDPRNGNYKDSRGLARALNGDREGAIEDFKAYIDWNNANKGAEIESDKRTAWIKVLEKGKNPFDETVLKDLLNQRPLIGNDLPTPEPLSGFELFTTQQPPTCTDTGIAWKSSADGMVLICVSAGKFKMGSTTDDPLSYPNEHPQHDIYLDTFWMDRTEITNSMYFRCVQSGMCKPPIQGSYQYNNSSYANHPVIVDWQEAQNYCQWANRQLPTEAQWEKAARGEDARTYPWGDDISCQRANYSGCVGDTKPVGSYPEYASVYGALDMAGNVWEWTADWYNKDYYTNSPIENPKGPTNGERHVLRGGAWDAFDRNLRTAYRNGLSEGSYGFRCVLTPETPSP
jgi:formylglycine-generating enzyme required for sulfatase activity